MTTTSPPGADGRPKAASLFAPGPRRSLLLYALGAVLGLLIAGMGLFSAKGTRTSRVPPEDVAVVNGVPILMSDYVTQVSALLAKPLSEATPDERNKVLDDMIREELYVQRGLELGMPTDVTEVRAALVGATEAQVSADAAMAEPDEAELRAYFAANPAQYSSEGLMTLDDYVLPKGADAAHAQAAAADLRTGADPATLARGGLTRSALMTDGEEFYFAAKIHLGPRLFEVARRLPDGGVSPPILDQGVVHVMVMRHNAPPVPQSFEAVRPQVLADYVTAKGKTLIAANDRFLTKRADILIAKGYK